MREDWKYQPLGEITTSINGLWKGKKPPFVNVGVIRNANFTKEFTLNLSNIEYLDVEERQYSSRKLQRGDLIVEKSGGSEKQPVGRTILFDLEGEYSVSNFTSILRIKDKTSILPTFLYKYLLYIYKEGYTKEMQNATTGIHNIIYDKFLSIPIPILSLSEQERIVALLDAKFEKIDAIKANAASQLQAAKDLFQSALKEVFEVNRNCKYEPLGEIVEIKRGLTYSKNDEVDISEKIVLRSNNVNLDNHQFDFTELKYLKPTFDIPADKYLQKGDLLMCMSNGSKAHLGKVALYEGESDKYAFGGFMAALSHKDSVIGRYLFYAMITPMYKEYIKTLSDGANINNLKVRDIEAFSIPVPPLPEQERIAASLDAISEKVKALQANYDNTITLCNDLKQSLLKSIFA